jgi:hypothetical protein
LVTVAQLPRLLCASVHFKRRKNYRATGAWRRLHSKRLLFNLVARQLLRDGWISSYLFFSVNLSPSPLISSMKLSLVTAILHKTVQQLFFVLPNEVQPRLLPLHSAEQGLHLAIDCILLLENHCKPSSSGQGLLSYKDLRKTNKGKYKIHIQQIDRSIRCAFLTACYRSALDQN